MAFIYTIDGLYKVIMPSQAPRTPQDKFFLYPVAEPIITAVLTDDSRKALADVQDEEIEEAILFILRFIKTPETLKGASLIDGAVRNLISQALAEINAPGQDVIAMLAILDAWFAMLKKNTSDFKTTYAKKPLVEDSSIFYFHWIAADGRRSKTLPRFYLAYAYQTHKSLMNMFSHAGEESSKDAYALSARYFFTHIHADISSAIAYPSQIPKHYIDLFVRQFDIDKNVNYDGKLSDLAKSHGSRLARLFQGVTINPHKPSATGQPVERSKGRPKERNESILHPHPVTGAPVILNPKEQPPNLEKHTFTVPRDIDDVDDPGWEFEPPPELEVVEQENAKQIVPEKPTLKRGWADLVNVRSFVFPWDSKHLLLYHYSLLLRSEEELWGTKPLNDAIITYICVLAATGMDHLKLFDLSNKDNAAGHPAPRLKEHSGRLFIIIDSIVKHKKEFNSTYCPRVSSEVWVPLSDSVINKITSIRTHGGDYIFSYSYAGRVKRLSLLDVQDYLDNINKTFGTHISPENISSSFLPFFHGRFNLDPLICVLASGRDYYRLYHTQLHYVHITQERFQTEYLVAYEAAQEAIKRNMDECIRLGFFVGAVIPERKTISLVEPEGRTEILHSVVRNGNENPQILDFGYGSPIICEKEYIIVAVRKLGEAINAAAGPIARHNLLTIFIYIYLQFCACLRPRNRPEIYWSDLKNTGTITICDKQSAKYHEERSIHLMNIMSLQLKGFESAVDSLKIYLMGHYTPEARGRDKDRVIFFVDEESGLPGDFTIKQMQAYLKDIDVDWTLPPNFPRHYTSNYLYACGLPLEVIEYWMGHQHAGREILNITSSTDLAAIARLVMPHIAKLVEELGFTKVIDTWKNL